MLSRLLNVTFLLNSVFFSLLAPILLKLKALLGIWGPGLLVCLIRTFFLKNFFLVFLGFFRALLGGEIGFVLLERLEFEELESESSLTN